MAIVNVLTLANAVWRLGWLYSSYKVCQLCFSFETGIQCFSNISVQNENTSDIFLRNLGVS